jgi:pyruvate ferredoxin oxidoreductase beta subunit
MHSWFRKEKFTTVMLDNEVYGTTGGQESGMTNKGMVLKMAPFGKKFEKMDMIGLAKTAGVAYIARLAPTNPTRIANVIRKAVLIAREVGPTYVQAYTSCNIEYAIPTPKVMDDARAVEKDRYGFMEIISDEAKAYLERIEQEKKTKAKAVAGSTVEA